MTRTAKNRSERIHAAGDMAVVYDATIHPGFDPLWFDRDYWAANGTALDATGQRGSVLRLERGSDAWVLRHYYRGGLASKLVYDHYVWLGLDRTRSFEEWRLLDHMWRHRLPVPRPVAARVLRQGLVYQADIVTVYLPATVSLTSRLSQGGIEDREWSAIGATIRRFHDHGVDHPDLTAHNILLGPAGGIFVVDFDNARLKSPGAWRQAGVSRLERSLRKVALETGGKFDERGWRLLCAGYR